MLHETTMFQVSPCYVCTVILDAKWSAAVPRFMSINRCIPNNTWSMELDHPQKEHVI